MKLFATLGMATIVFGATVAHAEDQLPGSPAPQHIGARTAVVDVDPSMLQTIPRDQIDPANPPSRIIYLNRCANGCTIRVGPDDSINQTSSIVGGTANFSPFGFGDSEWNQVLSCVRQTYSPFNVTVTDQDPGNVAHWEAIVAGTTAEAQNPNLPCDNQNGCVLGVAPGTGFCPSPLINNAIVYTFVNDTGWFSNDVNEICWVVAQETAHAFGLDHETLTNDPMTYNGLDNPPPYPHHTFMNVAGQCGANTHDDQGCYCPSTDDPQNSFQSIMAVFGASNPTPPIVSIASPANGANVSQGFGITVNATDDQGVANVSITIDGTLAGSKNAAPYTFTAPPNLADGTHRIVATATDIQGTTATAQSSVVIGTPCTSPSDCASQGTNLTCVGGRCVPDENAPGGLGTTCNGPSDCVSNECAKDSSGKGYCVEDCNLGSNDCPSGYDCVNAGHGICFPSNGSGGGCATTSTDSSPALPIGLGLALAALVVRRRRSK